MSSLTGHTKLVTFFTVGSCDSWCMFYKNLTMMLGMLCYYNPSTLATVCM